MLFLDVLEFRTLFSSKIRVKMLKDFYHQHGRHRCGRPQRPAAATHCEPGPNAKDLCWPAGHPLEPLQILWIWGSLSKSNKIWGKEQQKMGDWYGLLFGCYNIDTNWVFTLRNTLSSNSGIMPWSRTPLWLDVPKSWGCPFTKFVVSEFKMHSTIENSNYKTQLKINHATHQ